MDNATWPEFLVEFRIFGVMIFFRLFFSVEVIEVVEKFIKTVDSGEVFVPVAQMVFAKLSGSVALLF